MKALSFGLGALCTALAMMIVNGAPLARAQDEGGVVRTKGAREYKVAYLTFGALSATLEKLRDAQNKALNDFAQDGWRLVAVTQVGTGGQLMIYLER